MCGKCRYLITTPVGNKSKVVLDRNDSFDAHFDYTFMEIDRYPNGKVEAFIKHDVYIQSTGREYTGVININYCPFCGEKLKEKNDDQT